MNNFKGVIMVFVLFYAGRLRIKSAKHGEVQ